MLFTDLRLNCSAFIIKSQFSVVFGLLRLQISILPRFSHLFYNGQFIIFTRLLTREKICAKNFVPCAAVRYFSYFCERHQRQAQTAKRPHRTGRTTMRTLEASRKRWKVLFSDETIGLDLRQAIKDLQDEPNFCEDGLRSVCWKVRRYH
jgi:hypothetical protein